MNDLIRLVRSVKKNSVLIGDFNLPDIDWATGGAAARSAGFVEAVEDMHMVQMVDFATQIKGNCLDLLITNMPERITEVVEAGRLGRSDHEMICVKIEIGKYQQAERRVRDWRKANWEAMRKEVGDIDWDSELQEKTTKSMWTTFKEHIQAATNRNVPWRTIHCRGRAVWMTREIMRAIRRKKRLWKKVKGKAMTGEYREADKKVRNLIRNAKRRFEKKLATGKGGNNRPFFSYIKKKKKSRSSVGPLKNANKETVLEDGKMAEVLNRFFSSVFTREELGNIPEAENLQTEEMENVYFTEEKIRRKIRNLRAASAAGPDEIGPNLLQELEKELSRGLMLIYRQSFNTSTVPKNWKDANVTPIFKKGAKWDPGNYRPVSLTSVCCKIIESIVRDSLMAHLERNALINPSQHGFMPGRSCTSNLLDFFEKVTKVIDKGKPFDVVFLDFAKAFDKVPRERLLEKLRAHGVRGRTLNWIRQWLTGRRQRVVLNGKFSSWAEVLSGVPQGSVLGPILFLVFINDLDSVVEEVEIVRKFADDTKMGQTVGSQEEKDKLQQAIDRLMEWATRWGMVFNVSKCKVMHLGHNNTRHEYKMNSQPLGTTEEERDIGVTVMKSLKPSAQCAKVARTAGVVLGQLNRAFYYRDRHVFKRLYCQYVRPHLEFAVPVWSPWSEGDKECLEKVQKRAIKMVSGLKSNNYEERLKMGLTTLEERRHQQDMLQTNRILHGVDKVRRETWFSMASGAERETRQASDPWNIRPQAARLEIRKNFFSQRVISPWNQLPLEIKGAKTASMYRKHRERMVQSVS